MIFKKLKFILLFELWLLKSDITWETKFKIVHKYQNKLSFYVWFFERIKIFKN